METLCGGEQDRAENTGIDVRGTYQPATGDNVFGPKGSCCVIPGGGGSLALQEEGISEKKNE